jgi:hypothetical protein
VHRGHRRLYFHCQLFLSLRRQIDEETAGAHGALGNSAKIGMM